METKQERRTRRVATVAAAMKALYEVRLCIGADSPEAKEAQRMQERLGKLKTNIAAERFPGERRIITHGSPPHARYSATHWTECEVCTPQRSCGGDCDDGVVETRDCQCSDCADNVAGVTEDAADFAADSP